MHSVIFGAMKITKLYSHMLQAHCTKHYFFTFPENNLSGALRTDISVPSIGSLHEMCIFWQHCHAHQIRKEHRGIQIRFGILRCVATRFCMNIVRVGVFARVSQFVQCTYVYMKCEIRIILFFRFSKEHNANELPENFKTLRISLNQKISKLIMATTTTIAKKNAFIFY